MTEVRYVDLAGAEPDEAVVVVDVLRAFTVVPWMLAQGAARVLAVDTPERAFELRSDGLADAVLAGESGGAPLEGFDLGNSPSEVARTDLTGRTVIHRTSAGTQGLVRTMGSGLVLAASFAIADATTRALRDLGTGRVTFVITGASLGRDGDEDLACAELISQRLRGEDPELGPFLARVAASDAGRYFGPGGPEWAPPEDLAMAVEVDRFDHALQARPTLGGRALEVTRH
jgi:2-phosphosulfolactate phosphatase